MLLLKLIQLIHILNEILLSIYIFIFPQKYDIFFTIYLVIIAIHWFLLKNECIISYFEKKLIDNNYILGSKPFYHPYRSFLSKYLIYLLDIIKFVNIIVVLIRNNNNKYIYFSLLFVIGYLFYNLYKSYFINKSIKDK
jgi:hypothetical protein